MNILGYIALFFSIYNLFCGMIFRFNGKDDASRIFGIECSMWFLAAIICWK